MPRLTRRDTVKLGLGALAAGSMLSTGALRAAVPVKDVPVPDWPIEEGAKLRVLRPSKFVSADEVWFRKNTEKFTEATGVPVKLEFESWEDLRPKTAVAANVGSGPDVIVGWSDDPFQYVDKLQDMGDLAAYLGEKYGGWWPLAERYATKDGKWISIPYGAAGGRIVYRKSWVEEAGYSGIPQDLDGFLDLCRKLKKAGHPPGFALGNAVGDANAWTHWLVWAHGGAMVDENDRVIINSKETIEALKYGKALYETFIPGTESWLDANNNKAFLSEQIGLTDNGISIYFAAKNSDDPKVRALADDIYHAAKPIGPVGFPTERCLVVNAMVFNYAPYPNAAKHYIRFMMEKEQYDPFLINCIGYWNHPLKAYDESEVWTSDPKVTPYKHIMKDSLWDAYKGTLGPASQAVLADFVMVQMVAAACIGQATPEEAAAEAERRALRYYKS